MNAENPMPGSAGASRVTPAAAHGPASGNSLHIRPVATLPTTSTYLSPPWSWSTVRSGGGSDQLVPLAALAVMMAALVAIAGILALVALVVIRTQ